MWLAHHHEYALLAALCNMLVVSSFYSSKVLCISLSTLSESREGEDISFMRRRRRKEKKK